MKSDQIRLTKKYSGIVFLSFSQTSQNLLKIYKKKNDLFAVICKLIQELFETLETLLLSQNMLLRKSI